MNEQARVYYAGISDQGMVRPDNQDSFGKFPEGSTDPSSPKGVLFVIADGMGGHKGGKQASSMAVSNISESYFDDENTDVRVSLERAIRKANEAIYNESLENPAYANMGTTCSALVLQGRKGVIGHVGDSRIYRVTKSSIEQLTHDHSTVAEMQRRGILTKEEARAHPERSRLYRALGIREEMEIEMTDNVQLGKGEYYVLCTDGLINHVEEREIQEIVVQYEPEEAVTRLVDLANERGGFDNITVQIVKVHNSDSFLNRVFGS